MSEVVSLFLGQAGIRVGEKYVEKLMAEHSVNSDGTSTDSIQDGRCFQLDRHEKRVHRGLFVDLDPESVDNVRMGPLSKVLSLDSCLSGNHSGHDNFARVRNDYGCGVLCPAMDQLNRLLEKCDACQGVELYHGLGGGTGSALPAMFLPALSELYPKLPLISMTAMPSADTGTVAPYNVVLGMPALMEYTSATMWFHNDSMLRVSQRPELALPGASLPGYGAVNELAARTMANITCDVRLPSDSNGSWARFAATMVCFPRVHFFMPAISPSAHMEPCMDTAAEYTAGYSCFLPEWQLTPITPAHCRIYMAQLMYRGAAPSVSALMTATRLHDRQSSFFAEWLADNLHVRQQARPAPHERYSCTLLTTNSLYEDVLKSSLDSYQAMYRRRAYLHAFLDAGMDEMEFLEAESNLHDLISEVSYHYDATVE